MAKITGRIEVIVNGQIMLNKSGASASGMGISGEAPFERKPVLGDQGIHGFVETPVEASCEVTITDRDDVSLNDLANINGDGTVIFRSARGGKSYTLQNAACTNNLKVTGGEGDVPLKFVGSYWIESAE